MKREAEEDWRRSPPLERAVHGKGNRILIVQARLLVRGWTTGNVNTGGMVNAPAIDLLAMKGSPPQKEKAWPAAKIAHLSCSNLSFSLLNLAKSRRSCFCSLTHASRHFRP